MCSVLCFLLSGLEIESTTTTKTLLLQLLLLKFDYLQFVRASNENRPTHTEPEYIRELIIENFLYVCVEASRKKRESCWKIKTTTTTTVDFLAREIVTKNIRENMSNSRSNTRFFFIKYLGRKMHGDR